MTTPSPTDLHARAQALHLNGLLAHWAQVADAPWVAQLLDWAAAGQLSAHVDSVHRLDDIAAAFGRLARREAKGKVLVRA